MIEEIIEYTKITLYKLYYTKEFDVFNFEKYVPKNMMEEEKLKIKNIYINTLEKYMNVFVDIIKDHIIRKVFNIKKIKINIELFHQTKIIHAFILKSYELFTKVDPEEIMKSIVVTIYDENNQILSVALFGYKNVKQYHLDDLYVCKEVRKNPNYKYCDICDSYHLYYKCDPDAI